MNEKFYHAENANRTSLPVAFTLYDYICGTWCGVVKVTDEKQQAALALVPAVKEIEAADYLKCLRRVVNLPENMRPKVPVEGLVSVVGDGIPVIADPTKKIEVVAAEDVLKPVKVNSGTVAAPKIDHHPERRFKGPGPGRGHKKEALPTEATEGAE